MRIDFPCKNVIMPKYCIAKVSLKFLLCKMSPCKIFPSCKSDPPRKSVPLCKSDPPCNSDAVQKCPLVQKSCRAKVSPRAKVSSCKRVLVKKCHFVQKCPFVQKWHPPGLLTWCFTNIYHANGLTKFFSSWFFNRVRSSLVDYLYYLVHHQR